MFYRGVILRDLLYLEEANQDFRNDGSINISKLMLVGDILMSAKSFQERYIYL